MELPRGSKRRRFINLVNRNLEALLNVTHQEQVLEYELDVVEDDYEEERRRLTLRTRQINELRAILTALPRAVRRLAQGRIAMQIRDYIHDIRLENLPQDVLDMLNEVF